MFYLFLLLYHRRNFNSICWSVYWQVCSCFCWCFAWLAWAGLQQFVIIKWTDQPSRNTINPDRTDREIWSESSSQLEINLYNCWLPVLKPIIDGHIQKCWSFTAAIIQMPSFKLNTRAREGPTNTATRADKLMLTEYWILSLLLLLTITNNKNLASIWAGLKSKAIKRELCTLKKTFKFANIDIIRQVWSKYLIERKTMEEGGVELSQENY